MLWPSFIPFAKSTSLAENGALVFVLKSGIAARMASSLTWHQGRFRNGRIFALLPQSRPDYMHDTKEIRPPGVILGATGTQPPT